MFNNSKIKFTTRKDVFPDDTNKLSYFLRLVKESPENHALLLDGLKTRLSLKDNNEKDIDDICCILSEILHANSTSCAEVLEILPIIFCKHNRIPYSLLIDIAHINTAYAPQVFDILREWCVDNRWDERKLVHLYQILDMFVAKHPEFSKNIFKVASSALRLNANGKHSNQEAQTLIENLTKLDPELKSE